MDFAFILSIWFRSEAFIADGVGSIQALHRASHGFA